ncbi:MAG: N-acetyl sugar amidotransferase, partial [Deltaproteobacteria bacterium]|nr:N-acetyl sugar amidotransferase [Deltaproteobacteria bacterium]
MDETVPDIRFDKDGICHLCYVQDRLYKTHYIEQDIDKEKLFH